MFDNTVIKIIFLSLVGCRIAEFPSLAFPFISKDAVCVRVCAHARADKRRLTTGTCSEKRVVRRFRRCANVCLHKPR